MLPNIKQLGESTDSPANLGSASTTLLPGDEFGLLEAPLLRYENLSYGDQGMRGISIIELLIVVSMIFVISGFALMNISRARQVSVRSNVAREMTSYIEKARLDSIRRHSTTAAQMAQVTIVNSSRYSVTLDSDGDGTIDAARVINLPANSNLIFNGPFPRSIIFNWRGRTVDNAGVLTTPSAISITNSYGASSINLSTAGQSALDTTLQTDPITNTTAPAVTFRSQTQFP